MSNTKDLNKEFVSKAKELFQAKGYEVKTSHLYDVFAQLAGYKNWHTASAKNAALTDSIKKYVSENPETASPDGFLDYIKDTFLTADNQEEKFVLIDPTLPAWNYLVTGQVGSGKTMIVKKMLYSVLKQHKNPFMIILDYKKDNEYEKFTQLNKGVIINVATDLPHCNLLDFELYRSAPTSPKVKQLSTSILMQANTKRSKAEVAILVENLFIEIDSYYSDCSPTEKLELIKQYFSPEEFPNILNIVELFNLKIGECQPSSNHMFVILELLEKMVYQEGQKIKEKKEIIDLITETYSKVGMEEKRIPQLSDLLKIAKEKKFDPNFIRGLSRWTKDGEYPMFDHASNFNLSNSITLINLSGLDSQPVLNSIYHIFINRLVYLKMRNIKKRIKVVVRNDVNLEEPTQRYSLIEDLRTSRANGIVNLNIKDSPLDFYVAGADEARAILSNIQVNIFCKFQSPELCEYIGWEFGLKLYDIEQLKKLGIKKENERYYNTFMMCNNNGTKILKNTLSEQELDFY